MAASASNWEEFTFIPASRETRRREKLEADIKAIFKLFERDGTGLCDIREVGTMVRALGVNPREAQLDQMIQEMESDQSTGYIKYCRDPVKNGGKSEEPRRFYELMMDLLITHEFNGELLVRDSEEIILKAFETLDPDKKGYIDSDYFKDLMTTRGERFNSDEVLELLNAAADPETGYIKYEDYAPILACD
eukprot:TRINITY_DN24963_c0_g1_i1.p1 TRINITY_DN24963_c0_g1~~TRINITY_DN24963_c0_g1_i1.p1  ORF type:complete len:191 (+),score=94.83 TRINITY_DN24963_c0_g1_i1:67-639(+)